MRDFTADGVLIGIPHQSVHEASTVQKYPVGMIFEAFGKRWRYCRAAANITIARRGCPNLAQNPWDAGGYSFGCDTCTATGILGENYVDVTLGGDYDIGTTKDAWQGGILTAYPAAPRDDEIFQYHILGNDASHTSDTIVRAYLFPAPEETWTAVPVDGMPSPYMNVGASGSVGVQSSVIIVPEIQVASGSFFWGQTKGPAWVTPTAGFNTASVRECEFHTDGCIKAAAGVALQRAGYILPENSDADDAHIMLMLE